MTLTNYQIGLTSGSMVDLGIEVGAAIRAPKADPVGYSQYMPVADGTTRGLGWMYVDWVFGSLTPAMRDLLKAYCPGASNNVYITTRSQDSSNSFQKYSAIMIWPQEEKRDYLYRLNLVIRFNKLVVAS